jgi:hypothetical protein
MRTLLQIFSFVTTLGGIAGAQPVIFTALNSASSSALLSPGSWVSIYGVDFSAAPQAAQSSAPLPVTLGGVSVTVGRRVGLAELRFAHSNQRSDFLFRHYAFEHGRTPYSDNGRRQRIVQHPADPRRSRDLHPGW